MSKRQLRRRQRGFTLIELMVALVVAGILMASLVALSGSVQRSFGYSKDITELQTNLRFAMKTLVDDYSRVAYMTAANPVREIPCHYYGNPAAQPAISYDAAASQVIMSGNYISSRDFLVQVLGGAQVQVLCRDGTTFDGNNCAGDLNSGGGGLDWSDSNLKLENEPFRNLDDYNSKFCNGMTIRLDAEDRHYQQHTINRQPNFTLQLNPLLNQDRVRGFFKWINPITQVRHQMWQDPAYPPKAGPQDQRWVLRRAEQMCDAAANLLLNPNLGALPADAGQELVDFLLPPMAAAPGFQLLAFNDLNDPAVTYCQVWQQAIAAVPIVAAANADISPATRAVVLVLRGRTQGEDPGFFIQGFAGNLATNQNYGFDLDGKPDNGLAHVRVERTLVQLTNLGVYRGL